MKDNQRTCHFTGHYIEDGEPTVHAEGFGGEINRMGFQMLVGYQIRKLLAIGECTGSPEPKLAWDLSIRLFHESDPMWWDARYQYAKSGEYEAMHYCNGNQNIEYLRSILQYYDVCVCLNT